MEEQEPPLFVTLRLGQRAGERLIHAAVNLTSANSSRYGAPAWCFHLEVEFA